MTALKRGDYFTHRHYFTDDGTGPRPLVCKVTRVAKGCVHYRGVYGTNPEQLGGVYHFPIEQAERYAQ